jgi:hypothetical protein
MNLMKSIMFLAIALVFTGLSALGQGANIKVTDINGVTTLVSGATSSSSSSCHSPDFPAVRGGTRKDVNFNDLKFITVLHDRVPGENDIYINVELEYRDGKTEAVEMIRNIRFSGTADSGPFSIMVKDISMVEVLK